MGEQAVLIKDVCPREEAILTGKPQQKVIGVKASKRPSENDEAGLPGENLKTDKIEKVEVEATSSKPTVKSDPKAKKAKDARLPHDVARLPHENKSQGKKWNGQDREPFLNVVDRDPRRRFGRRIDDQVTISPFLRCLFIKAGSFYKLENYYFT